MTTAEQTTRVRALVDRHPVIAFVTLAYGISWTLWAVAFAGGGDVVFLLGVFGPAAAAAIVIHARGESIKQWLRPIWHLRVAPRWWLFALGLPILLFGMVSLVPAQDHLILMPRSLAYSASPDTPDWVILGVYVFAALVLVAVTRGRLGRQGTTDPPASQPHHGPDGHETKELHV